MIRGPIKRVLALASAALFLLAAGPGWYGVSECLHHAGQSDHQEATYEPPGTRHSTPTVGSGHDGVGHLPHTENESAPDPCTCDGSCVIAPAMGALPRRATVAEPAPASGWTEMSAPATWAPSSRAAYFRPYPTGPPEGG